MRILRLRFKNLNSLQGEWHIDLTHPAFLSEGIFAITGPTGSGKSTILDAICLALYGRTPRLNKITKSGNEIMSRQTGECFAEVSFTTQAGCFRCHWSQRRARKRPDGELQAPRHEISSMDGTLVESSIRGVAARIEAVTGMDFERFTRSMLLAQGDFATFLQAAPDERAPILEQITGTETYSRISIRVHERQREEREILQRLQVGMEGIVLLDPEEEAALRQALAVAREEEAGRIAALAAIDAALQWRDTVEGLRAEGRALDEEAVQLEADREVFRPEREKLQLATCAASLDGQYATLAAVRNQQQGDLTALHDVMQQFPDLEKALATQKEALHAAEEQVRQVRQDLQDWLPVLQQVRLLDQQIADRQKAVTEADQACQREESAVADKQKAYCGRKTRRAVVVAELETLTAYCKEHAREEWLCSALTGIEEQLAGLSERREEMNWKERDKDTAVREYAQAVHALEGCRQQEILKQQELAASVRQVQGIRQGLQQLLGDRLLREYRAEKEALLREKGLREKIAALSELRDHLKDGEPCPLCGAREHPLTRGTIPAPDALEGKIEALTGLIDNAEAQEAALKAAEIAEQTARHALMLAETATATAERDSRLAEKRCMELKNALQHLRESFAARSKELAVALLPLGIHFTTETDGSLLRATLRNRLKLWTLKNQQKLENEKALDAIDSELQHLEALMVLQQKTLAEKRTNLAMLQHDCQCRRQERKRLFGDRHPDTEEARYRERMTAAEMVERAARNDYNARQQQWQLAHAHRMALQDAVAQRTQELNRRERAFTAALAETGFDNEEAYRSALLSPEHREALEAAAKALDARQAGLIARKQAQERRLAAALARNLSDKSGEMLRQQRQEHEDALQAVRERIAGDMHRLQANDRAAEQVREKQAAVNAQQKECLRWDTLHNLIGSADGRKFRNFAQGLTFDIMIAYANCQLMNMTDRYVLVRDSAQSLELNVIDNYQAGEIRSTKNLSGGESFLVSLSLALGLSQMASRNVRVDSLFLDEGFGTLDEDSLDMALETLSRLQRDGKLIGVISHVPALKERIRTQIQVRPHHGGRSRISGPGCRKSSAEEGTTDEMGIH